LKISSIDSLLAWSPGPAGNEPRRLALCHPGTAVCKVLILQTFRRSIHHPI
jgi:hypothetical protein